jgi:hypothetical protein
MRSKGYVVFESPKPFDLNIYGVRTRDLTANRFNDWIGVMYLQDGIWCNHIYPATTDPGTYYRENPMNVSGTAVLRPGQYRGVYILDKHNGYDALRQRGPMVVYRDANRDTLLELDEDNIEEGMFGLNLHRASLSKIATSVDKWSAGCQVVQLALHFDFLIALARAAVREHGNSFTYTLLTEQDFRSE